MSSSEKSFNNSIEKTIDNSFKNKCLEINTQGERLLLHPKRVVYWPSQKMLLAADIHAGKEHYFGRNGIAIPGGISETSLTDLFSLSNEAGAKRIVILGDFMHAVPTHSEQWLTTLSELLQSHPKLEVSIVAGNHDKDRGKQRIDQRIQWHENTLFQHPFVFQHEPGSDHRGYVLCGHIHPAWRVKQSRRSSIKTPAFWFSEHFAVLPSFGQFTGGVVIAPNHEDDRIFMLDEHSVLEVPTKPGTRRAARNTT